MYLAMDVCLLVLMLSLVRGTAASVSHNGNDTTGIYIFVKYIAYFFIFITHINDLSSRDKLRHTIPRMPLGGRCSKFIQALIMIAN